MASELQIRRRSDLNISEEIRRYFGSRYCIPTGSGTTGLYLALLALDARGGKVVLPERTCLNVVSAVLAAGCRPVAVEVDAHTYNMSAASVAASIDDSVKAVLAVSSFGYPADLEAICEVAGSRRVPVIDDACQAYGGEVDGVKTGNRGDIGVVSFGHAKPVDVRGGGAVLTDSEELYRTVRSLIAGSNRGLAPALKNYALRSLMLAGQFRLTNYLAGSTRLLNYGMPRKCEHRLKTSWPEFVKAVPRMRQDLRRVDELVRQIDQTTPFAYDWSIEWLPWRYSFKTPSPSVQNELSAVLRKHGIATSTLYGSIRDYIEDSNGRPGDGDVHCDNVINLRYGMTATETAELVKRLERTLDYLNRRPISPP